VPAKKYNKQQMKRQISIKIGSVTALAELNNTRTADAIWHALPFSSRANTWGEEIYFSIPVEIDLEDGQEVVNAGDLGYWPTGAAFCIFFGRTPASRESEIRAASPVNIFGSLLNDPKVFLKVKDGENIIVERLQDNTG